MMSIKNWDKFQHYKYKSKMPWFKLYGTDLLNDIDWNKLKPLTKVILLELWCVASETLGELPDKETLCFRLRIKERELIKELNTLIKSGFIIDDEKEIELEYNNSIQVIRLDKDNIIIDQFDIFWGAYPRKVGKANAEKAWLKHTPPIKLVLDTLKWQLVSKEWFQDSGKYIPHPTTWINAKRWLDEPPQEIDF